MAAAADILQRIQRFDSSRDYTGRLSACIPAVAAFIRDASSPASTGGPIPPLNSNIDPFHTFTELIGRKRNNLNTDSRAKSSANIAMIDTPLRPTPKYSGPPDPSLADDKKDNFDFTNHADVAVSSNGRTGGYESTMQSIIHGVDPGGPMGYMGDQQQHFPQHSYPIAAWARDEGAYATTMPSQPAAGWSTNSGMGHLGDAYAGQWPEY